MLTKHGIVCCKKLLSMFLAQGFLLTFDILVLLFPLEMSSVLGDSPNLLKCPDFGTAARPSLRADDD